MDSKEFTAKNRIKIVCEYADKNPNNPDWKEADHWKCRLSHGRKSMTVYFSQGYGHNGKEPDTAGVLDCLASDAAGVEDVRSFEDWCSEYGYDTDSRKAEKTFNACERTAEKLKRFLGNDLYRELLFDTERL